MKLYFSPGACSLSPHIVLREAGLPFELVRVDFKSKKTASGQEFSTINPKGAVPTLQLDGGEVLTEGPAIVQYLADQKPGSGLAPPAGSFERYRLMEWLNYVGTELHKGFSPLFKRDSTDALKQATRDALLPKLAWVASRLEGQDFLLGKTFTVADAYLFTILTWANHTGLNTTQWPALQAYFDRISARPAVKEALAEEARQRTKI